MGGIPAPAPGGDAPGKQPLSQGYHYCLSTLEQRCLTFVFNFHTALHSAEEYRVEYIFTWDARPTCVKLDEICDLACLQVNLDRIIHFDEGVWIADGTSIVGDQMRDSFGAHKDLPHLAQLVLQTKPNTA